MPEFSLTKIKKTLEEFKKLGGERIDITGGEPMVRQDINQIIKVSKDLDLKTELVTNATLLNDKNFKEFKRLGLDQIAISLDGSIYPVHQKIRGISKKEYEKVLNNIQKSKQYGFKTKVNTVVFQSNFHDLINITKLCLKLEACEHGLYFFSPIGRGSKHQPEVADPLAWLKLLRKELIKLDHKIKLSVEVPLLEKEVAKKLNTACYLDDPWHLQLLPDGQVFPCAIMCAYQKPLGNLYQQSLTQIWHRALDWHDKYYEQQIKPLFQSCGGCVNYPSFSRLIKTDQYEFVCLCRKFKIKELIPQK